MLNENGRGVCFILAMRGRVIVGPHCPRMADFQLGAVNPVSTQIQPQANACGKDAFYCAGNLFDNLQAFFGQQGHIDKQGFFCGEYIFKADVRQFNAQQFRCSLDDGVIIPPGQLRQHLDPDKDAV